MTSRAFLLTAGAPPTAGGDDGELFGLIPERQALPAAPHIVVDGVNVTTTQEWTARDGAVLPIGTQSASSTPQAVTLAGKLARYVWDELNPGVDYPVVNDEFLRHEGNVVLIDFMPGSYWGQTQQINHSSSSAGRNMFWQDSDGTGRVIRDICFRGAGAEPEDVVFPSIDVQNFSSPGRGQADNLRFENLHMQNTATVGAQAPFRIGTNFLNRLEDHPSFGQPDGSEFGAMFYQTARDPDAARGYENSVWWNTSSDRHFFKAGGVWVDQGPFLPFVKGSVSESRYQGVFKFYDCLLTGEAGSSAGGGSGCTWSLTRCAGRATGFDLRGCRFGSAFEHCAYISTPQGLFYAVNCVQVPWNGVRGTGNTMFQFDCRPIGNSGPIGFGTIAIIRCNAKDNVVDIQEGGSDFTFGAFDGTVYLIDCLCDGVADSGSTGQARGMLTVVGERWVDSDQGNISKGFAVLETSLGSDEWCHIQRLELRRFRVETVGNKNQPFTINGVGHVYFDAEYLQSDNTTGGLAQIEVNNKDGQFNLDYLPNRFWEWGPSHQPLPSSSPPFLAGTSTEPTKVFAHNRSDFGTSGPLSDAQIDAYDGSDPV